MLLSSVCKDWPEEVWLDAGIMYPFCQKDYRIPYRPWADELIYLAKNIKLCTTQYVKEEVQAVWTYWGRKKRSDASKVYSRLFSLMHIKRIETVKSDPLSAADVSLLRRPHGCLFTSDKKLYYKSPGDKMLLTLVDTPYSHLKLITDRGERRCQK